MSKFTNERDLSLIKERSHFKSNNTSIEHLRNHPDEFNLLKKDNRYKPTVADPEEHTTANIVVGGKSRRRKTKKNKKRTRRFRKYH
jgi:hypothetical protein